MDTENDVIQDSSPEQVEVISEDVKTPDSEPEQKTEKTVPYSRFQEVVDENKRLKTKPPLVKTSLDVGDYIDISASLEGLDSREKERLAREHKLSGRPLKEIREDEDFKLWQSAYRQDVEKKKASLIPSNKQPDDTGDISLEDALNGAQTMEEKERILQESMGYSIQNKPRSDRVNIGR
jgi:hypothetical protein